MARVLAIVSFKIFPPQMGGQKAVALFYQSLQAFHSLTLAVSFDNTVVDATIPAEPLIYQNKKMLRNFFRIGSLKKMARQQRVDCIVAEHSYTGWLALFLRMLTGKPFIIRSHNIEAYRFRQMGKRGWKLYALYEGWIHRRANHNFFISGEDMQAAVKDYRVKASRCSVVPYGINNFCPVAKAEEKMSEEFSISSRYVFYFNGTLDYAPNRQAVEDLLYHVHPLLQNAGLDYTLVISGKFLPETLALELQQKENIRYLGFVEDVNLLYQGCHLFLNAVVNDSGVKTKLVEALANHCTVVSTASGASGMPMDACGQKLHLVKDNDWPAFVAQITKLLALPKTETPPAFFARFNWQRVAEAAAEKISSIVEKHEGNTI